MKRRVKVSEAEVQKLGGETVIRAHFSDELRVNELFAFGELAEELVTGWATKPAGERNKFLEERPRVLKEGDRLAAPSPEGISALIRKDYAEAQAAWRSARARLLELS
jgi:hypothetical protein